MVTALIIRYLSEFLGQSTKGPGQSLNVGIVGVGDSKGKRDRDGCAPVSQWGRAVCTAPLKRGSRYRPWRYMNCDNNRDNNCNDINNSKISTDYLARPFPFPVTSRPLRTEFCDLGPAHRLMSG